MSSIYATRPCFTSNLPPRLTARSAAKPLIAAASQARPVRVTASQSEASAAQPSSVTASQSEAPAAQPSSVTKAPVCQPGEICPSCTPAPAAPAAVAAPSSSKAKDYAWRERWWPLALVEDLPTDKPTAMQLLGDKFVLWRDAAGKWQAFADICSHRQAPLSDGRINDKGDLECCYHGWSFDGSGKCTSIPLAATPAERAAANNPRAAVSRYPVTVSDGVLWVWPRLGQEPQAAASPPPELPAQHQGKNTRTLTIARDLELPYEQVLENVCDPAHVPFAHHGVLGDRNKADPTSFRSFVRKGEGFTVQSDTLQLTFHPPYAVFDRMTLPGQKTIWFNFIAVPLEPGRTRLISIITRDFITFADLPRWISHFQQNDVLDGDAVIIQQQQRTLDPNVPFARQTYCPTKSDRGALEFHRWLERVAGAVPWAKGTDLNPRPVSAQALFERKHQHADICKSCGGALRGVRNVERFLRVAEPALLAAAVGSAPQNHQTATILAGLAALGAAVNTWGISWLKKHLTGLETYERR